MANSVPAAAKKVNQLPPEEPVQPAVPKANVQNAEIVKDKEKQSTAGYVNSPEGQKTLGAPKAPQQPSAPQPGVDDTYKSPKGRKYTFQPTKNGDRWVDQNGKSSENLQRNLTLGWQKQQAAKQAAKKKK
jgi:hypothetical protein